MKLGEKIKSYRSEHDLSLRQFAEKCGVSHAYVGYLEQGSNPSTGRPIVPNLARLTALAKGMEMSVEELISEVDDFDIAIEIDHEAERIKRLMAYAEKLNSAGLDKLQEYADDLSDNPKYQKE